MGLARLVAERPIARGAFLIVRRLGFAPVRTAFGGGDSLTVELTDAPRTLPVLATETKVLKCPSAPEPAADSLWRTAAARYTLGTTRHYLSWTGSDVDETVTGEQRGYGAEDDFSRSRDHHSAPQSKGSVATYFMDPPPYGDFERHINIVGEYWKWRFVQLERVAAEHFLSEGFHERHTLRILGRSEDATILGFCPLVRGEADIEGELQIGSDSLLRSARWFFRVPHDDEDVGGEATFGVAHFEGATYLVAVRGSSWRRAGRNLYHQHRFENSQWRLSRTPS
jgi:hypothetical protein